ncbi:MAG: type IV pilin [Methanoregula sp.]|nr:type IV pilin [Methanoregula sp.]
MKLSNIHAVSSVVGIMLMIVVVIVIAAVVAGFSGGMVGSTTKNAPTLILDVKIINTGFWYSGSGFYATVSSASRPIPTNELKIVTSWTIVNKTTGERETGGSTVMPNITNVNHNVCSGSNGWKLWVNPSTAPFGAGSGIVGYNPSQSGWNAVPGYYDSEQFGSYMLVPGTTLSAPANKCICSCLYSSGGVCPNGVCTGLAYGADSRYTYGDSSIIDPAIAVLGQNWNHLRAGDTVNVKVIHIPTNSILFDKNILVTEG